MVSKLTDEEIQRVNVIVADIQKDLNNVISAVGKGNFDEAIRFINDGISRSTCPVCKKELKLLNADVVHNQQVCILEADTCDIEKEAIIEKTEVLRDDFIPVKTNKKAIKDKNKKL